LVRAVTLALQELPKIRAGRDVHNEEYQKGEYQRRFEILEFLCVQCQWNREEKRGKVERELADGNFPRSGLKPEVEHDLRRDAVNGAVEDPSFDAESEDGQGEVGRAFEEGMGD
jgi:hypothetical protein